MTTSKAAVLVVEDHPDTAAMIVRLLRRRGMEAQHAEGGEAALRALAGDHPAVVIMDEMMPDLPGLEVVRRMRADPATSDIPVIFYSASFDFDKQQAAEQLGAVAWLVKGVSRLNELVDKVVELCQD